MTAPTDLLASTLSGPPSPAAPDPFDPAALRLNGVADQSARVKKVRTTVPVRKPDRSWFFRAHPDPTYRVTAAVLELKDEREMYIVRPEVYSAVADEKTIRPMTLVTAVNRQGAVFLLPLRLPNEAGKLDAWGQSMTDAVKLAETEWCRVQANMALSANDLVTASGDLGDPAWPSESFAELLRIAFRNHCIDTIDHPVLRQLRGEA